MSEPCPSCGVRGDVDCQHRPGSGQAPAAVLEFGEPVKKRRNLGGQGHNFHRGKGKQ